MGARRPFFTLLDAGHIPCRSNRDVVIPRATSYRLQKASFGLSFRNTEPSLGASCCSGCGTLMIWLRQTELVTEPAWAYSNAPPPPPPLQPLKQHYAQFDSIAWPDNPQGGYGNGCCQARWQSTLLMGHCSLSLPRDLMVAFPGIPCPIQLCRHLTGSHETSVTGDDAAPGLETAQCNGRMTSCQRPRSVYPSIGLRCWQSRPESAIHHGSLMTVRVQEAKSKLCVLQRPQVSPSFASATFLAGLCGQAALVEPGFRVLGVAIHAFSWGQRACGIGAHTHGGLGRLASKPHGVFAGSLTKAQYPLKLATTDGVHPDLWAHLYFRTPVLGHPAPAAGLTKTSPALRSIPTVGYLVC
ncbi:hypothetical protein LZ30DRAFT_81753 [Colletotrichum cereale]|nr:hypothetical protein LZ30DRAFT_81753 [Colletotrichum cereale]